MDRETDRVVTGEVRPGSRPLPRTGRQASNPEKRPTEPRAGQDFETSREGFRTADAESPWRGLESVFRGEEWGPREWTGHRGGKREATTSFPSVSIPRRGSGSGRSTRGRKHGRPRPREASPSPSVRKRMPSVFVQVESTLNPEAVGFRRVLEEDLVGVEVRIFGRAVNVPNREA